MKKTTTATTKTATKTASKKTTATNQNAAIEKANQFFNKAETEKAIIAAKETAKKIKVNKTNRKKKVTFLNTSLTKNRSMTVTSLYSLALKTASQYQSTVTESQLQAFMLATFSKKHADIIAAHKESVFKFCINNDKKYKRRYFNVDTSLKTITFRDSFKDACKKFLVSK